MISLMPEGNAHTPRMSFYDTVYHFITSDHCLIAASLDSFLRSWPRGPDIRMKTHSKVVILIFRPSHVLMTIRLMLSVSYFLVLNMN